MLDGLAEADAGVDADRLFADPLRNGERQPLVEKPDDVGDDVVVARVGLHRPRLALHVHQADVDAGLRDRAHQLGVAVQRGDVVDELDAELERPPGDAGLRGVDRERLALEMLEHRHDAPELLLERHGCRPRPRRLAADVDDCRPGVEHPVRLGDRGVAPQDAVAAEGVRRDVDDAHHRRARETFCYRKARARHGAILKAAGLRARCANCSERSRPPGPTDMPASPTCPGTAP